MGEGGLGEGGDGGRFVVRQLNNIKKKKKSLKPRSSTTRGEKKERGGVRYMGGEKDTK